MRDFATSDDPRVQAQLDRLGALTLPQGRFGLETIRQLLARLGDPQKRLPPTFHVAGTNGKGSTCAYLRAMLETQGLTVHAATKPHLVRYNERIRLAGKLIEDALLADLLEEVLDLGEDLAPSFFEVTAAATFLAFAHNPADACVIEVGLGGRFDATNVLDAPAACGIASLGIDHEAFLLRPEEGTPAEPLARIAFEKAGIARAGRPLVTQAYPGLASREIELAAERTGAVLHMRGKSWWAEIGEEIAYRDAAGALGLPLPRLPGAHQADNAALAVAMLRHQSDVAVSPEAMAAGILAARWPARLQRLGDGPLTALVPGRAVWLDGGHNPDAGAAIAGFFSSTWPAAPGRARDHEDVRFVPAKAGTAGLVDGTLRPEDSGPGSSPGRRGLHLVIGMLANKDPSAILAPLADLLASVSVVPAPGHEAHRPQDFAPHTALTVRSYPGVKEALGALPADENDILIAGSLYLAGEVLRLNREIPD